MSLGCSNPYIINNLPNSIEELKFNIFFDLELDNLPNSIKKILFHFESDYNKELNNLPKSLEYLELNENFDKNIFNIPSNLLTIKCSEKYKYINNFNEFNIITY